MLVNNKKEFLLQLYKTASWCEQRIDLFQPKTCFRTPEFRKIIESHDEDPEDISNSSKLIADIIQARNEMISNQHDPRIEGRVLLCVYNDSNANGITNWATNGYFDDHDNPPWDTWICEFAYSYDSILIKYIKSCLRKLGFYKYDEYPYNRILAAWVPEEFVGIVEKALEVECMGMLMWADLPDEDYREVYSGWFKELYLKR